MKGTIFAALFVTVLSVFVFPQEIDFQRSLKVTRPRMNGEDVLQAQQRLSDLGYDEVGDIDGWYGPMSSEAVTKFQRDKELDISGVVDLTTWDLINSIWVYVSNARRYSEEERLQRRSLDPDRYVRGWNPNTGNLTRWILAQGTGEKAMIVEWLAMYSSGGGSVSSVLLEEMTPSGDWSRSTEYFINEDGSISVIITALATFYTNVILETELFFDEWGEPVHTHKVVKDLETEELLEEEPESLYRYPEPIIPASYAGLLVALDFDVRESLSTANTNNVPAEQGIIFAYNSTEFSEIRELHADGTTRTVFRIEEEKSDFGAPSWSHDGDHIAFIIYKPMVFVSPVAPLAASFEMVTISPGGSLVSSVAFEEGNERLLLIDKPPVWSPDGENIAYFYPISEWENQIKIIDRNGEVILSEPSVVNFAWTSIDDIIAVERLSPAAPFITLATYSENGMVNITDFEMAYNPSWAPARDALIYCSIDPVSGTDIAQISFTDNYFESTLHQSADGITPAMPGFSHNGSMLAFIEYEGLEGTLSILNPASGNSINTGIACTYYDWSPDEHRIVVYDGKSITCIDSDGANEKLLIESDGLTVPSW